MFQFLASESIIMTKYGTFMSHKNHKIWIYSKKKRSAPISCQIGCRYLLKIMNGNLRIKTCGRLWLGQIILLRLLFVKMLMLATVRNPCKGRGWIITIKHSMLSLKITWDSPLTSGIILDKISPKTLSRTSRKLTLCWKNLMTREFLSSISLTQSVMRLWLALFIKPTRLAPWITTKFHAFTQLKTRTNFMKIKLLSLYLKVIKQPVRQRLSHQKKEVLQTCSLNTMLQMSLIRTLLTLITTLNFTHGEQTHVCFKKGIKTILVVKMIRSNRLFKMIIIRAWMPMTLKKLMKPWNLASLRMQTRHKIKTRLKRNSQKKSKKRKIWKIIGKFKRRMNYQETKHSERNLQNSQLLLKRFNLTKWNILTLRAFQITPSLTHMT